MSFSKGQPSPSSAIAMSPKLCQIIKKNNRKEKTMVYDRHSSVQILSGWPGES